MKTANIINSQPLNVFLTFSRKEVNASPLMVHTELCRVLYWLCVATLVHVTKNHKTFMACYNTCFARAAELIWGLAWQLCWIWQADAQNLSRARFRTNARSLLPPTAGNKVQADPHWRWGLHSTLASVVATTPNSQGKGNERKDRQRKRPFWWRNMLPPKIYSPRDAFVKCA